MSNFRIQKDKNHVLDAIAHDNEITIEPEVNDYVIGEMVDLDTDKVRITGKVTWTLGKYFKMKIEKILHKVIDA
jgi:hypothetical protein